MHYAFTVVEALRWPIRLSPTTPDKSITVELYTAYQLPPKLVGRKTTSRVVVKYVPIAPVQFGSAKDVHSWLAVLPHHVYNLRSTVPLRLAGIVGCLVAAHCVPWQYGHSHRLVDVYIYVYMYVYALLGYGWHPPFASRGRPRMSSLLWLWLVYTNRNTKQDLY